MCRKVVAVVCVVLAFASCHANPPNASISDLLNNIYETCFDDLSQNCIKVRTFDWMSQVADQDAIGITEFLSIIKTNSAKSSAKRHESETGLMVLLDIIDRFLTTHSLQLKFPSYLKRSDVQALFPGWFQRKNTNEKLVIPLSSEIPESDSGRSFVRKVMMPFLLGLKFKTSILVPLMLALIALKTWKAITFGLLSLVVSVAIVIFKLIKPNVVNYEIVNKPYTESYLTHQHIDNLSPYHPPEEYIYEQRDRNFDSSSKNQVSRLTEPVHINAIPEIPTTAK